jgi:dTDP-4-amino-4,6-dideoxygalactose transaminase
MIPHSRPSISDADIAAVTDCLRSNMIAEGEIAAELETALARRYGFSQAIVTGSGCQALYLALKALDIRQGARVALPTYVCPEVLGVIENLYATPIIADVGEDYLLDENDCDLTELDAIIIPALLGRQADVRRYKKLDAPMIADWAQYAPPSPALAADAYEVAIISFEATKFIAAGEGGAVLVRDAHMAERVRAQKHILDSPLKLNLFPFSDMQAALALSQLKRLDEFQTRRAAIAAHYSGALNVENAFEGSAHYRFVARVDNADAVLNNFEAKNIIARRPVDPLLHHVRPQNRVFPTANVLWRETISLPCYPTLSDNEIQYVAQVIDELLT